MTAEEWKLLGVVLCVVGIGLLAVSQFLIGRYRKRLDRELFGNSPEQL